MVRLVPMTELEFDEFMEISMRGQAQDHVQAGTRCAEEAAELLKGQREQLLPDGLATPMHFFFTIQDRESGTGVGGLWYALVGRESKRQFFVVDIQVYDEYRRHGYGTQAFKMMEEQAQNLGIATISLHVFKHNHSARAMYKKLGYVGTAETMSKELASESA